MQTFFYVYILASEAHEGIHYTGVTRDLKQRLLEHNQGKCLNTARHRPWRIEMTVASDRKQKPAHSRNI